MVGKGFSKVLHQQRIEFHPVDFPSPYYFNHNHLVVSGIVCSRTAPSRGEMYCLGCSQYSRNYWPHLVCRRRERNNDNQRRALHGRVEAILRQTEKKKCRCGLPMVHAGWGYSPHCELYPSVAQIKVPGPNHQ